ncbi:MAG: choice-of-anchor I family protein [Bacteroidia bacterium]|nr:choice-of-anchor I family protein [Bacteroidia bacterium]MDW8346351.1 choice-of-anchor I family protein [Bacteroidia bacterium]
MKKTILALLTVLTSMYATAQSLTQISSVTLGPYNTSSAEIAAYDSATKKLFVINGNLNSLNIISIANPASPVILDTIYMNTFGSSANSVAVKNGIVAVSVTATNPQDSGLVVFYNTSGTFLKSLKVGPMPDMICFTPDGNYILTANEGEPNNSYSVDPEGSISVINISGGIAATTQANVKFATFNHFSLSSLDPSIRIFGPGASVAQDLEPEYITVDDNSQYAYVTCQENNAIAKVHIPTHSVVALYGLGFKDHNQPGKGLDASDNNGYIYITPRPVKGMYQPDGIASYTYLGQTYLVTANEGDQREYAGFNEVQRVKNLTLDPSVFPTATTLKNDSVIGRLNVTTTLGNGSSGYTALYSFGARSFSIWNSSGTMIYDSGDEFEQKTAQIYPNYFNCNHNGSSNARKTRSDDKGPEPEGVAIGKVGSNVYAFIGLERIGGVMVYNITNPNAPSFVEYYNPRNFAHAPNSGLAGDLGVEGVLFIPASASPNGQNLLVLANEISGNVSIHTFSAPVSVQEDKISENAYVHVYPNPNTGHFVIQRPTNEPAILDIFDIVGKKVFSQPINGSQESINAVLNKGMYVITVQEQGKTFYQKMIVE